VKNSQGVPRKKRTQTAKRHVPFICVRNTNKKTINQFENFAMQAKLQKKSFDREVHTYGTKGKVHGSCV
jgi:hypothetical protein